MNFRSLILLPAFRWSAVAVLIATMVSPVAAMRKDLMNAVYFEYGGTAILYSINYDRILLKFDDRNAVGARVGFSWLPFDNQVPGLDIQQLFIVPVTLNYIWGKAPHFFETGLGVAMRTYINPAKVVTQPFPAISLGYRAKALGSGTLFRADFTPVFYNGFMAWFGISLGRAF